MGSKASPTHKVLPPVEWEDTNFMPLPDVVELRGKTAARAWAAALLSQYRTQHDRAFSNTLPQAIVDAAA